MLSRTFSAVAAAARDEAACAPGGDEEALIIRCG